MCQYLYFSRERFPYYNIEGDPVRNTVVFRNGDSTFTIEELIAQMLQRGRENAQDFIGQPITECVLVVPGFFGQAERQAMLSAAKLINLKVLQLQNDYTAVALNYGIFRSKEINETAQYFLFYDMGALKTSAVVVGYQLQKEKGTREINPVASILGVGYDRNLGGLEMQLRMRDHLAAEFNALKKTKTDVRTNARAMAKLFKEAGRVKNILSANTEHYAQIEGLLEEMDFRVLVTREQFETMCEDLFARVPAVLDRALSAAGLSLDVMTQVIIVGGGTRVPKVQDALRDRIQQELGKNLNADEAATMGAVYRAADLATGFKVKKFVTKDAVVLPLQVVFEREAENGEVKQVRRTLFSHMNPFPQKKVITFNKHTDDFAFDVNYADLDHLSPVEIESIGNLNLTRVSLTKVAKSLEATRGDNVESKGIKAHFAMDDSGLIVLTNVELVIEKTVTAEDEDESPLSKLGSTISKLFSSEKAEEEGDVKREESDDSEKRDDEKSTAEGDETADANKANVNETAQSADEQATNKTEKPKIVTIREPIVSESIVLHTIALDGDDLKTSKSKVKVYDDIDKARIRRETALNKLETFVIDAQEKLKQKEYAKCANAAEKEEILKSCAELSEWMYDEGSDADAVTYEKKLDELERLTNAVFSRHWEHRERPDALKALKKLLEEAEKFLTSAQNLTKEANPDKDVFTAVEIQTLEKAIRETQKWREEEIAEQKKMAHNEDVRLTVKSITDKMALLDREVKYLVHKIKIWKPKAPKEVPKTEKPVTTDEDKASETGEEGEKVENQEEKPVVENVDEGDNVIEPTETENGDEVHTEL